MPAHRRVLALVLLALLLLAACGSEEPVDSPATATRIALEPTHTLHLSTATLVPPTPSLAPATVAPPTPTAPPAPIPPTPTPLLAPATVTPIPAYEQLVQLFEYDKDLPLDLVLESEEQQGNATVQSISYAGGMGFRVPAYLVLPAGEGYPAVVYLHKGGGDKDQFLSEALMLAEQGVASLLLASPFVTYPYGGDEIREDYPGTAREGSIRQIMDIRRGIDLLETMPEVDASRIGYVGHSFGAVHGGITTGVERRISAYVLIAGLAQTSAMQASTSAAPGMLATEFDPALDAIHYVGHGSPAAMLFQFGELDSFVDRGEALLFFDSASEPKTILWYTADHGSIVWKGREDRLQWLGEQLGFAWGRHQ
jgi:dienelactone hydrolase